MENLRKEIANRLQAARKQAGLTQGQVAMLLGVQRPTISEIEAGRRRVSAEELADLSKIYGVSMSWITAQGAHKTNPAVELAARELAKLKKEDLDAVINLLNTLRSGEED
ncbi:helix-turn-helix domain-containing protein [Desulfovibrio aminophilus]|uniref:helix-turn-helix domain-containing protein n=1 Tax=Desulfovibrio aminophilus TaxID=81425 RepID=UPI003399E174